MAEYSFLTTWELDAPIEQVWAAITDSTRYPEWWKYVASVEDLSPGDEHGVGRTQRTRWTSALPYGFVFETRVERVEPPRLIELSASGELAGRGRWELSEAAGGTRVRYAWQVRTTKRWMNLVAPLLRPAAVWNHHILMTEGGEALARRLGARLLQNETIAAGSARDRLIGRLLGGFAVGASLALVARQGLRRR
jgi:uncharacterized protein YndB with AHSA1/START domain